MTKELSTENMFVVKFDYNIEHIKNAVAEVDAMDLSNIEEVKEKHKLFVKIRTTIKKQEKEMVDGANSFRNAVFAKRNEYLELSEPVEQKLKKVLDDEERRIIIEARKELLQEKKDKLSKLKIEQPIDDFLLELDEQGWVDYYANALNEHQNALAKEEGARKEAEARKEREAQMIKEAEERARKEAEEKANAKIRELELEKERAKQAEIARQAKEQAEKELAEKQKKDAEEKERAEAAALAKRKEFNEFLAKNNYNKDTDIVKDCGNEVRLYKLVATFKK